MSDTITFLQYTPHKEKKRPSHGGAGACVNCRKAHAACNSYRPCDRCVRMRCECQPYDKKQKTGILPLLLTSQLLIYLSLSAQKRRKRKLHQISWMWMLCHNSCSLTLLAKLQPHHKIPSPFPPHYPLTYTTPMNPPTLWRTTIHLLHHLLLSCHLPHSLLLFHLNPFPHPRPLLLLICSLLNLFPQLLNLHLLISALSPHNHSPVHFSRTQHLFFSHKVLAHVRSQSTQLKRIHNHPQTHYPQKCLLHQLS